MAGSPGTASVTLSVIVVSYNVRDLLRTCLRSVFASAQRSADWLHVDVIVVDNASVDGSAAMVAAEFPKVHLIASEENLGFTGGNNFALEMLGCADETNVWNTRSHRLIASSPRRRPDFVLLLNPDTEIVGDALGQMVSFLRAHPSAGACGAYLRYGDGSFQHGAFRFPTLAQVALDLFPLASIPGVRRFLPRLLDSRLNGRYPRRLWNDEQPFPVDFVLGAALMVRADAIQQIGLLDDAYFMYCEEMDWCLRLRQAGWGVYAVPTARVIHHEGQSSRQAPWSNFARLWRSRFRFFGKHAAVYPPGYPRLLRLVVYLGLMLRSWQARRRFAQGEITGDQLAEELSAYETVTVL